MYRDTAYIIVDLSYDRVALMINYAKGIYSYDRLR